MSTPRLSDVTSCLSDYDPDALPVEQAQQIIFEFVTPVDAVEMLALRGILFVDTDGVQRVRITGAQGSGILRSMVEANCMVVPGHSQGAVRAGELVDVVVFEGLY